MKVLWVANVPPPDACLLAGQPVTPFGGWLQGSATALTATKGLQLAVAFPSAQTTGLLGVKQSVRYIGFEQVGRRDAAGHRAEEATRLVEVEAPDLVHIHGTEMPHALSFALAAQSTRTPFVVSIQGMVSVIAQHMSSHLPPYVVYRPSTRPWRRSEMVAGMGQAFREQGRLELEVLGRSRHVIGRTSWDRACTQQVNPGLNYHHCEETLRPQFYEQPPLDPVNTRPQSIMMGQGHYPIKGLHLALEALPLIRRDFPDIQLSVTGHKPLGASSAYARYLRRLIIRHDLGRHVRFTGPQDTESMISLYRGSAVVLCPSVIENSPNTVAEGMLLGRPVVAAHVGGIPDMIRHLNDGLTYQADAPYMMADAIIRLLGDPVLAASLGDRARARALRRHEPTSNAARTLEIYRAVMDERGTQS